MLKRTVHTCACNVTSSDTVALLRHCVRVLTSDVTPTYYFREHLHCADCSVCWQRRIFAVSSQKYMCLTVKYVRYIVYHLTSLCSVLFFLSGAIQFRIYSSSDGVCGLLAQCCLLTC